MAENSTTQSTEQQEPPRRVLVAVPTTGSIHPILASRLIKWGSQLPEGNINFYFTYKVAPVDRARNQIVDFFLKTKVGGEPLTHILMVDADTIPPVEALDRLLSHDKDIISGVTPILSFNKKEQALETYDNCFSHVDRDESGKIVKTHVVRRNTGLQELFRCGASCILIKREVFEKLPVPYFLFVPNDDNTEHVRSEDIYFCDQAREAGFKIFCDTDVVCNHDKSVML